jgi:osmotically-inducible protein OsmY
VPDPDSSWRPSVAEERRAFMGFRAMDPAEQELYDDVHDALLDAGIDTTPLHIEVDRDRVILRGQVHDHEALLRIPGIVGDVPGVSAVIDQLVIAAG